MTKLERVLYSDLVYRSLPPRARWDDDIREAVRLANIDVSELAGMVKDMRHFQRIARLPACAP
jgi:hypothetical protein